MQNIVEEKWCQINGYEGKYKISNLGRVFSITKNKIMLPFKSDGRLRVTLINNGNKKNHTISRLVAIHFIPNPLKLPQVDHIDGNRENNAVTNLRWCDNIENQNFRAEQGIKFNEVLQVMYGGVMYKSRYILAQELAITRGVKFETTKNRLRDLKFGGFYLYGEWCEIISH